MYITRFLFLSFIAFALNCDGSKTNSLNIQLNMRTPLQEGWFNPDNEIVGIRGDLAPLSWGTTYPAADPDGDSIYTVDIPFEIADTTFKVSFKAKVDGTNNPEDGWQKGRNHTFKMIKGMTNEYFLSWESEGIKPPSTITGQVEIFESFDSTPLESRDLHIYLPPGYADSNQRYPVLYMHDGQNLFDEAVLGQEWQADEAAEALITSGEIQPIIIVGIGNTRNRLDEYTPTRQQWFFEMQRAKPTTSSGGLGIYTGAYVTNETDSMFIKASNDTLYAMIPDSDFWQTLIPTNDHAFYVAQAGITFTFITDGNSPAQSVEASKEPNGGLGDTYGNFILEKVKPFVDQNLRTKPETEFTALGGSSLGGLITMHLGLKHPDVFSKLLVVSPSVWWDNQVILREVTNAAVAPNQRVWLDVGSREGEGMLEGTERLYNALLAKGWAKDQLNYVEAEGAGHSEVAWAARFPDMLRFIFPAD